MLAKLLHLLHTHTSTAIKSSLEYVDYLRFKSTTGSVLIWSEATNKSKLLRVIANDLTVKPGYLPATISNQNNRSWVNISSPVEGWVCDGTIMGDKISACVVDKSIMLQVKIILAIKLLMVFIVKKEKDQIYKPNFLPKQDKLKRELMI